MYNNAEQHNNAKSHFTVMEQYWKTVCLRLRPLIELGSLFKMLKMSDNVLLNAAKATRI